MFVLHVDMKVKPESLEALVITYLQIFKPAITRQEGFKGAELLRPREDGSDHRLTIAFDHQASQQKWIATDLHQDVWGQMEAACSGYTVLLYDSVAVC